MRRSSVIRYDFDASKNAATVIETFSNMEKLDGHGNAHLYALTPSFPKRNINLVTVQVSKRLQAHHSYSPGEQPENWDSVLKLNTNENPYPPSPLVKEAVTKEINLLNLTLIRDQFH